MKCIIKLGGISSELRSRSIARKIFNNCSVQDNDFELDFKDVIMISRSFADEIFEFIDLVGKAKVSFSGMSTNIELTLKIVDKNRTAKRKFNITGDTKTFDNVDSLKEYLSEI